MAPGVTATPTAATPQATPTPVDFPVRVIESRITLQGQGLVGRFTWSPDGYLLQNGARVVLCVDGLGCSGQVRR